MSRLTMAFYRLSIETGRWTKQTLLIEQDLAVKS